MNSFIASWKMKNRATPPNMQTIYSRNKLRTQLNMSFWRTATDTIVLSELRMDQTNKNKNAPPLLTPFFSPIWQQAPLQKQTAVEKQAPR